MASEVLVAEKGSAAGTTTATGDCLWRSEAALGHIAGCHGPSLLGSAQLGLMSGGLVLGGQACAGGPHDHQCVDEPPGGVESNHGRPMDAATGGPLVRGATQWRPPRLDWVLGMGPGHGV